MTATRCRRVRTARSRRVGSRKRTQSVQPGGGSARGGNPLDSRGRYPQECINQTRATKPMVGALSFPLFRPFKALKSPPADRKSARGGRHAECVSNDRLTVEFEPCA